VGAQHVRAGDKPADEVIGSGEGEVQEEVGGALVETQRVLAVEEGGRLVHDGALPFEDLKSEEL